MILKYKELEVFYSVEGTGNAIVLLHGFLENSTMWKDIVKELSTKNKVVCIDLLGHGKTSCQGYIHTMEDMAVVVKEVLRELRLRKVIIIGHSMGGYVGLAFAEKYPENLKGLCLLNSTSQADSEERKELRLRAIQMAQTNYKALVSMSITNLFALETRNQFSKEIEILKEEALQIPVQGYIAATHGMRERTNRENVLFSIQKKLLIAGENDPILPLESVRKEALKTKTPLHVLPNGHMSYIETKEELITVLKSFVQ